MAKRTLLDMTQNILSAMDSDEVNSIGDTIESLQVAEVLRETYEEITVGVEIPGRFKLFKLDSLGDVSRPNSMVVPSDVEKVEWIRYNGEIVTYKTPPEFVDMLAKRTSDDSSATVDGLVVYTDRDPRFYTSFDDDTIVFDAYNTDEGATLMQSRTNCWGQVEIPFLMEDDFVPMLPLAMFPRLLSEAKAACFINFKQVSNSKEEQRARRQKVLSMNNEFKAGAKRPIDRLPNYGRKR